MEDRRTIDRDTLHSIDTRLSLVEQEVGALSSAGKWLRGIGIFLLIQVIGGVIAFTKLSHQVDNLNLSSMQSDISTTLSVLASHRQNIDQITTEQARLRGVIDNLRQSIAEKTHDRFTGSRGDLMEKRIDRLENFHFTEMRTSP